MATDAVRFGMDIDMVISVTVFLPRSLWAREGAPSAPTQSWKQAQLLRYSQNGTVVFSPGPAQVTCQVPPASRVILFTNFSITFSVSWSSFSLLYFPFSTPVPSQESNPPQLFFHNSPRCSTSVRETYFWCCYLGYHSFIWY